jgi:hypothetical protein
LELDCKNEIQSNLNFTNGSNENISDSHKEFDTLLKQIRLKNIDNVIVATLNINSIRNKFDQLKLSILGNIDILVVIETKLDETFETANFILDGFSEPFRRDRDSHGGGILI